MEGFRLHAGRVVLPSEENVNYPVHDNKVPTTYVSNFGIIGKKRKIRGAILLAYGKDTVNFLQIMIPTSGVSNKITRVQKHSMKVEAASLCWIRIRKTEH